MSFQNRVDAHFFVASIKPNDNVSKGGPHTFLQEPVVGGISGSSLERRLPVGTPGVVGLRFARNGDENRT